MEKINQPKKAGRLKTFGAATVIAAGSIFAGTQATAQTANISGKGAKTSISVNYKDTEKNYSQFTKDKFTETMAKVNEVFAKTNTLSFEEADRAILKIFANADGPIIYSKNLPKQEIEDASLTFDRLQYAARAKLRNEIYKGKVPAKYLNDSHFTEEFLTSPFQNSTYRQNHPEETYEYEKAKYERNKASYDKSINEK